MSLVGTRPPTVDEWEKYELHHRSRMSIKPGITGMWQVSGRSDITDFEEVVKLDTEYIENWSIGKENYNGFKLKCEGYNTIAENVIAHGCELGYGSGISKGSMLYNTKIGR